MKIAPGLVELLAEAKQDVPDKLKQIARAYHVSKSVAPYLFYPTCTGHQYKRFLAYLSNSLIQDNGGRRAPRQTDRSGGFGSVDIRKETKEVKVCA